MSKVESVVKGFFLASVLSLAGYKGYVDFTDKPLERVSPLAKQYDENENNQLDFAEAVKLVVNEFDRNKDGHLSKEEQIESGRFLDKFKGQFQHRNIQETRKMFCVAEGLCMEWSEDPQNVEMIKKYWDGQEREEMLKYIALRSNQK